MKLKLLLLAFLFTTVLKAQTNFDWIPIPLTSSNVSSTNAKTIVLFNDTPYLIGYVAGIITVEKFNLNTGVFTPISTASPASTFVSKIKAKVYQGKIYIVIQGNNFFECGVYENDINGFNTGFSVSTYSGTFADGWEFDVKNGHLFIGSISILNKPVLHDYNVTLNTWSSYDLSSTLNNDNIPNLFSNNATLSVYCSSTDVYFGFSMTGLGGDRLGKAPINAASSFGPYGVNYKLFKNSGSYEGFDMYLYGDGNNPPKVTLYDDALLSTYTKQLVSGVDLDVNTSTESPELFNVVPNDFAAIHASNYHILLNKFALSLTNTPFNFNFQRYDVSNTLWETNSTNIPFANLPAKNSIELGLSDNEKHLSVFYEDASGQDYFYITNSAPVLNVGASNPNNGICSNNQNLIVSDMQMYDDQNDSLRVLSITGINLNNGFAVFKNRLTTVEPNVVKQDVYADVLGLTPGSYQMLVEFTDGYDTITTPINHLVNASGTLAQFSTANYTFCESAPIVELAPLLNIHNGGQFTVNSHLIEGSTFNALPENWLGAFSGNLAYKTFIDGCKSETFATYTLEQVGVTTITTGATNCGTPTGTADWTYVPDNAGEVPTSIEWSTGSNNNSLSGLDVGQYYCDLLLPTGCRSRGYGTVLPLTMGLNAAVTNVSCNGGNNGAIDLTITNGPASYNLVWSNGYSSEDLSNLKAGTYTVTLYETGGCSYYASFTVSEPDPIQVTFSKTQPTCGNSNGDITAYPAGGSGTYFYNWTFNSTTSNQITAIPSGIYELKITDGFACQLFVYPNLNDQFASTPSAQIINTTCNSSNGAINVTAIPDGTNPLTFVSVEWDNGTTNLLNSALSESYHSVKLGSGYFLGNVCYAFDRYYIETEKPRLQDICIVTVDLATTTNMVVWEKGDTTGISHYNIYRETNTLGEYLLIDTVNVTSESIFNDVVISPMISSWRYRLSAVNSCGQEGPLSPAHKTLLMNTVINVGPGTVDVLWDDYEGTADIAHYQVNRYSNENGWEALLPVVTIGTSTFQDTPTGLTNLDYFVETVLNTPCQSEKINDFNSSRSNRERGTFAVGEGTGNSNNELSEVYLNSIELYPNPTINNLQIIQPENNTIKISVYSVDGTFLFEKEITSKNDQLSLSEFASGIYFVHLHFNETAIVKRVMKN
jgi:Secretion system C-terminal sorting domain/SprB repeat